jgi:hypothetical protein
MPQKTPLSDGPSRTRYGATNPERVKSALWQKVIQKNWNGYNLRQYLKDRSSARCEDYSHSSYRESTPGPFWSWERFGRTTTKLPDGRVLHIAGEHEDAYDPDFCIYSEVVVEHPDGRWEFYLYPRDVFPPTDFHTATLIDDEIILIGSLGYRDLRRPGETQVLKLDTRTLRIAPIATTGEGPGWISRHTAEKRESSILVVGGKVQTPDDGYETNEGVFELDLTRMVWRRRQHGDVAIFPIPSEVYRTCKNPRYGTANPERSDNSFWLEMARRHWPPSRARLHFGDFAPPEPKLQLPEESSEEFEFGTPEANAWLERVSAAIARDNLVRTIDDVVWTAAREETLRMTLPDGRMLQIGGEVKDYGDEYADPWVYNDVIVTHPDGAIDILSYPKEVFPLFFGAAVGTLYNNDVYLFGMLAPDRNPERPSGTAVLRLDTSSYKIAELPAAPPSTRTRVNIYPGSDTRDGNRILFPLVRMRDTDPELGVAFDLETLTWSKPFPHAHPQAD